MSSAQATRTVSSKTPQRGELSALVFVILGNKLLLLQEEAENNGSLMH